MADEATMIKRRIEAQVGRVTVTDEMQDRFADWFRQNYPGPDTIIHKPDWHAPKILRAALQCIPRSALTPADAQAALDRLMREARNEARREAAEAVSGAAWKHEGDDAYSRAIDNAARKQNDEDYKAILALMEDTDDE